MRLQQISKFKSNQKAEDKKTAYQADVQAAGVTFAGYLQAEPVKLNVFEDVSRGSAVAKFPIGMGAGSTYFDATVQIRDGVTGENLGEILVDKNSWVLGAAILAAQNVEGFMRGGAEKVARELYIAKFGKKTGKVGIVFLRSVRHVSCDCLAGSFGIVSFQDSLKSIKKAI